MGGTSTDVSLCQNGQPTIGRETAIAHFRIRVPSVDVHTVGAGGGSIAHVPELTKALRVGPQSAGADPGPAAYGRGGTEPTVTDANVVLGHLPPQLLGGEMSARRRRGAGRRADDRRRARPRLGRGGRGGDPRDREREHGGRAAARLGAARPRPARLRARRLRRRRAAARERRRGADGLLPGDRPAGARPALRDRRPRGGLPRRVRADVHPLARRRRRRTRSRRSSTTLGGRADAWLDSEGIADDTRTVTYTADMRYHGQGYEIPVALDPARSAPTASPTSRSGSTRSTSSSTASACTGRRARSSTCARSASARCRSPSSRPASGRRRCVRRRRGGARDPLRGRARADAALRPREAEPGTRFDGPAIVTEFDSTTVVLPGFTAEVDTHFNILINPKG